MTPSFLRRGFWKLNALSEFQSAVADDDALRLEEVAEFSVGCVAVVREVVERLDGLVGDVQKLPAPEENDLVGRRILDCDRFRWGFAGLWHNQCTLR